MKEKPKSKTEKSRLHLLHQYYSYTGFYAFVGSAIKKSLPYVLVIVIAVFVLNKFFNISEAIIHLTEVLPVSGVLAFFFISETLLGLIPPEMFIAWSGKMDQPWLYLSLLAFLSYFGGLCSYWIGIIITKIPTIHQYLELKMANQLRNSKKWGGLLILVGALLPLPLSISCVAAGIIEFPFRNVILYGSFRLLRFLIYGLVIFHVMIILIFLLDTTKYCNTIIHTWFPYVY